MRGGGKKSPFGPLISRAGRRRRSRRALALAAKGLVPGFAAAVLLAGAWRLTGRQAFLALALASVALPTVSGAAAAFVSEDSLRATAELDRRAGLDGLLATGLEISRGAIRTSLAPVALRKAKEAAGTLDGSEIPLAPPPWARYLSLPAALFVATLALPVPDRGRRPASAAWLSGESALAPADSESGGARGTAAERRADETRQVERRETSRAIAAYKAAHKEQADRARRRTALPAAPPLARRPRGLGAGEAVARASSGTDVGAGDAEAAIPPGGPEAERPVPAPPGRGNGPPFAPVYRCQRPSTVGPTQPLEMDRAPKRLHPPQPPGVRFLPPDSEQPRSVSTAAQPKRLRAECQVRPW